jgi:plastocyanin
MGGAVFLTATVSLIAAVSPAEATSKAGHEAKRCGIVAKGSADYRIKSRKIGCATARRWARAYLRRKIEPSGYSCYPAGPNVAFYCSRGSKAYWAERLGASAAAHPGHGPERVDVANGAFGPDEVTIGTSDTVLWVWRGPDLDHTVTADPGQGERFDSDPDGTPERGLDGSFAHFFTRPGTYTYFCRRHPDRMRGSVRVVRLGLGDSRPPRISRLRVGREGRRIAFRLSEGAIVLARIQPRAGAGWRSARDFDVFARKGRNRPRLPLRGLAPGPYRVRVVAYDDADNASRPAFARLRV